MYAWLTFASGRLGVVTVSFGFGGAPALTLIVYCWSDGLLSPQPYDTVMKKVKLPASVGVPRAAPSSVARVRPGGNAPDDTTNLGSQSPGSLSVKVAEYDWPTVAVGHSLEGSPLHGPSAKSPAGALDARPRTATSATAARRRTRKRRMQLPSVPTTDVLPQVAVQGPAGT